MRRIDERIQSRKSKVRLITPRREPSSTEMSRVLEASSEAGNARMMIARVKRAVSLIIGDLGLLASVYFAHFIVRRTIRVRRKERAARLNNLKLIDGGRQGSSGNKVLMPVRAGEKGMSREALPDRRFGHRR